MVCISANGQSIRDLKPGSEPQPLPTCVSTPCCLTGTLETHFQNPLLEDFSISAQTFLSASASDSYFYLAFSVQGVQGPWVLSSQQTQLN